MKLSRKSIMVIVLVIAALALAGMAYSRNRKAQGTTPGRNGEPGQEPLTTPGKMTATGKPRVPTAEGPPEITPRPIAPVDVATREVMALVDEALANGYRPWESSKSRRRDPRGIIPRWTPKNEPENRKWLIEYYTNLKAKGYAQ